MEFWRLVLLELVFTTVKNKFINEKKGVLFAYIKSEVVCAHGI